MPKSRKLKRRVPSENTTFEMLIRKEQKLRSRSRGFWLEVALSHQKGYSFATQAWKAEQLGLRQYQAIEKWILSTGFFRAERPQGVHRATRLRRVPLSDGETPDEFVARAQAYAGLDIATWLHWVACDGSKETGRAEFSTWGMRPNEALRQARQKMKQLGHFSVQPGQGRGKPSIYTRLNQVASGEVKQAGAPQKDKQDRPVSAKGRARQAQEQQERQAAVQEQERREIDEKKRQEILAFEAGFSPAGITGRRIPPNKKTISLIEPQPHRLFAKRIVPDQDGDQ